jgi:hypothetical protein
VIEGGQGLRLAVEARKAFGIMRDGVRQDFDRDASVETRIPGAIDDAHTAFAQLGDDLVRPDSLANQGRCFRSSLDTPYCQPIFLG